MSDSSKKSFWILPLAVAVLVALLGWWGNGRLKEAIEGQLKAQLTATLNANVTALGIWTTNQTQLATSLAEDSTLRTLAVQLLKTTTPFKREQRPPPELEQFANELRPRLPQLGYQVADLVGTNYMVMANTMRVQRPGAMMVSETHTNKFAELFATGKPVIITPFKPEMLVQRRAGRNRPAERRTNELNGADRPGGPLQARLRRGDVTLMQVAAPVREPGGEIVGALALIINPDKEFSRILSVARWGDSGETYAFDQTGLMISRSRFDDQLKQLGLLEATNSSSALNFRLHDPGGDMTKGFKPTDTDAAQRPLAALVANAVEGVEEVVVQPVRDYRGVRVVGASCWLPQFGFGVATQIDADEAYRTLRVLQLIFVLLFLFLLMCATVLFLISNLTWRRRLGEAELKLRQLGQYTLEEKIGEGGMGVVYRARHALLRRDTAVKLLMPDHANPEAIARFEREVCLTCQLTHPNTIQVYDYGHTPDGIFYYAMEYLRGLNLHELLVQYGPQPESRVIHILTQVCGSLAEAHANGLIHRDIKPGNVFLCQRGGEADCVKVLDFGLVREYRADEKELDHPESNDVIEGTPWFTPPEAIRSTAQTDPRSDLYSLGVLGYFLLTGHYIFDADTVAEIHEKQLSSAPVPPSQRTENPVSSEIEKILLQCLEKDAHSRPQSAAELHDLLLACPAAHDWAESSRLGWWKARELQPHASTQPGSTSATPLPTVKIDLGSRL